MTGMITVSIWHNVTRDHSGRHTGYDGFSPGDQMVKVFTYDTPAHGRSPAGIAASAFATFNDAPGSDEAAELGPPVPGAAAALTVVLWKVSVLRLVVLPGVSARVVPGSAGCVPARGLE
jgi:hypothetical protein